MIIYPKLSDGTIDWCVMCKHEGRGLYDGCCECEYPENPDDPPAKYEPKPITNAERIRAMSVEEMAEFISGKARTFGEEYEGYMSVLDWLKQEVSTNG